MTPKEFVDNFNFEEQDEKMWLYSEKEVYTLLEEYGKQQWNEAIKLAAESADWEATEDCVIVRGDIFIDKETILKLLK